MSQTTPAAEPTEPTETTEPNQPNQPTETNRPTARGVTEEEIAAAMSINSVPDEVRLHSSDPAETEQTMDTTGQLRRPADHV